MKAACSRNNLFQCCNLAFGAALVKQEPSRVLAGEAQAGVCQPEAGHRPRELPRALLALLISLCAAAEDLQAQCINRQVVMASLLSFSYGTVFVQPDKHPRMLAIVDHFVHGNKDALQPFPDGSEAVGIV